MDDWVIILGTILALFALLIFEFIISFFFSYKIFHVTNGDFKKAARAGATSTFLFTFSTLFASIIGAYYLGSSNPWVPFVWILLSATFVSIGNFFATYWIPQIDEKIKNNKEKRNKKKNIKKEGKKG